MRDGGLSRLGSPVGGLPLAWSWRGRDTRIVRPGVTPTADLRQDRPMADSYRTPDGWTVEVVTLDAGDRLRIRHHGFYVADVANVDDLARWIPAVEFVQLERDTLIPAA